MSCNEYSFILELKIKIDKLSNLLSDSEKYVTELFKELETLASTIERDFEIKIKNVIKNYKSKHVDIEGKYQKLQDKLSRENFQFFFYGKVSTGKSKIINAILRKDVFHSASSHTTSCFVKICKSSDEYHHTEYTNQKNQHKQLDDLKQEIKNLSTTITHSQNHLETQELLLVYLNIPDNEILTSNTEIIDCPGSANTYEITNYIKDKGLNANVFIFVLTGEITEDEKMFFQYQWEHSSKPKIFFLVNKWDQAYHDGEDVAEDSKKAITQGLIEFLTNQIRLSEDEIKNRIFFVSALDICKKRNIGNVNSRNIDEREKERCCEFEDFEKNLSQFRSSFLKGIYREELGEIEKQITKDMGEFKNVFRKERAIENIEELKKFLRNIEKSAKRLEINKDIKELENKLRSFVNKCEKDIHRHNIELLENEFISLMKENQGSVFKLHMEITHLIDEQIKEHKRLTNVIVMKDKHELKEIMKMDVKLKTISDTLWDKFCDTFTKVFKFLRGHFLKTLDKKDKLILEENIESVKNDTDKLISGSLHVLSEYVKTETDKIINQLKIKINAHERFSRKIEHLF